MKTWQKFLIGFAVGAGIYVVWRMYKANRAAAQKSAPAARAIMHDVI